jgi:hypothetical protein
MVILALNPAVFDFRCGAHVERGVGLFAPSTSIFPEPNPISS